MLALAVLVVGAPALGASYSADDWGFASLGRHLAEPWQLYLVDHSYSYFYRPNGLLLWWLAVQAFGDATAPQYAASLLLHALNAALLARLARVAGAAAWVAAAIALAFALHPATFGTALWLADRFDLLATAAVLALLLAAWARLERRGRASAIVLAALLAAGAKETAIVALPAVAALALLQRGPAAWRERALVVLLAGAPFALMLAVRALVLNELAQSALAGRLLEVFWNGGVAWLRMAPVMLAQTLAPWAVGLAALASIALVAAGADRVLRARSAWAASALVLALAPGVIQAPVTGWVFSDLPAAFAHLVNGRFYYLAFAGLALSIAVLAAPAPPAAAAGPSSAAPRGTAWIAILLLLATVPMALRAHALARRWRDDTSAAQPAVDAARRALSEIVPGDDCQVRMTGLPEGTAGFLDVAVKAGLPRDDPRLACVIRTEAGPYYAHVPLARCAAPSPGLVRRAGAVTLAPHAVANVCMLFPDPAAVGQETASFRWDGARFVRE